MSVSVACDSQARFPFKRKRLRFLRFSFTQRTQRKRLRLNGNRASVSETFNSQVDVPQPYSNKL